MNIEKLDLKKLLANQERVIIEETLVLCQGNQSETARMLGISRSKLIYKLKEYSMKK